jgi:hypothetical protein
MSAQKSYQLPKEVGGVKIPDSRLAQQATELAWEVSPEHLFNHVFRTYIFGALLADQSKAKYDSEMLYLGAIFHDLGLTEKYNGDHRFEVDGADAASDFLTEHNYPADKTAIVWDAIALHTSIGIVDRKQPEIAFVSLGAGVDIVGLKLDQISPSVLAEILAAYPRLGLKQAIMNGFSQIYRKKPQMAMFNIAAEFVRNDCQEIHLPTFRELVQAAPFNE